MTKFIHCVFVRHESSNKPYLFCVDDMDRLRDGQKVICDTKIGESKGVCVGNSFCLSELALKSVAQAVGAELPLKRVLGIIKLVPAVKEEAIRFDKLPF